MSDVEPSQAHMTHVDVDNERRRQQGGRPATTAHITMQAMGLEPQHVRVADHRSNGEEPAAWSSSAATTAG